MKLRELNKNTKRYALVRPSYLAKYHQNAIVERVFDDLEEAEYHRASLYRNDEIWFSIYDCYERKMVS